MFYCQISGHLSKPGVKPERIVVAIRPKNYTRWVRNEETNDWEEVIIGSGWEIVKEVNASQEGVAIWNSWNKDQREAYAKGA